MIVGKQKPPDEIWAMIRSYNKVLILGCNTCIAVCHEGGGKEAEILASLMRIKAKQAGVDMEIRHAAIERQCEHEFFDAALEEIERAEAVLTTACGVGVQFMAEKFPSLPVSPGVNTTFLGATDQPGVWEEKCQACGQCILDQTGGICPVSRCAKRILNGPCGGSSNGKCEIDSHLDCAWQLIIERLRLLKRLDDYEKLMPIKDWSSDRAGGPRKLISEKGSYDASVD